MKTLIFFSLLPFILMFKPTIINLKQKFAENLVSQWTNSIKNNNLPLYTLFPMCDIAIQLEKEKIVKKSS